MVYLIVGVVVVEAIKAYVANLKLIYTAANEEEAVTHLMELTSELVHAFVEKLVVFAPRCLDGQRVQFVDIHYNGVGVIRGFSPEEMERAFQEHVKRRGCIKTA